jgi:hypothetical protein
MANVRGLMDVGDASGLVGVVGGWGVVAINDC